MCATDACNGTNQSTFDKGYPGYTRRPIIAFSGHDLNFATKWADWIKSGKPEGKKPGNPTLQHADFSTPIDGYIQFDRGSDKEAPKWKNAD